MATRSNRTRRREREDEPAPVEEFEFSPEEIELSDFLDGLGPQGISEVSLYRILPSGKQRFITSGPPVQFSEQFVQGQFGEGDYLARAKLNGRWYKSKSFSVEASPGAAPTQSMTPKHDAELERLKAQIESQRLEMERDRQAREQRNHELQLKMLEALGSRGSQAAGPSLTELIASVEALRNLAGNGGGLTGFKEVLEIADRINSLRGDGKNDDSWLGLLKSVAPELAQAVTHILLARNGQPAGPSAVASLPNGGMAAMPAQPEAISVAPLPTAYDQVAGQLRGLLETFQAQIKAGLDPAMAVETLLALEVNNDPIAQVILNAVEKSSTFESWLTWLRSQIGAGVVIEQSTVTFLSNVFETVKSLPSDYRQTEGQ
jgi:hypothetical protein